MGLVTSKDFPYALGGSPSPLILLAKFFRRSTISGVVPSVFGRAATIILPPHSYQAVASIPENSDRPRCNGKCASQPNQGRNSADKNSREGALTDRRKPGGSGTLRPHAAAIRATRGLTICSWALIETWS